jgi:hypothetical protein
MPAPGTICEIDDSMFHTIHSLKAVPEIEDHELLDAVRDLSAKFTVPKLHL